MQKFVSAFMPQTSPAASSSTTGTEPIFDGYGIEIEIDRALERKVWLKSGGYLIIDQGEALTAIDVNTGASSASATSRRRSPRPTSRPCREVADQLRLRNIGGIIVVDFIDMDRDVEPREGHRARSTRRLRSDRAKANVTKISELGLVEMTRKRTRESLGAHADRAVLLLRGQGLHQVETHHLLRDPARAAPAGADLIEDDTVLVERATPRSPTCWPPPTSEYLEELEKRLQKRIVVRPRASFHLEQFEIRQPRPEATRAANAREQAAEASKIRPARRRVTINHEFASVEQFITEYVTNISRSGVFIRSQGPAAGRAPR